ncbi:MAG: DNA repair protein RecN [Legionellaceae bacterium]|nr:DNA repair protein RecN [Legionellaceae bacterium]
MLRSLVIDNLAIVTHLELDFSDGMTAFTGETGAGKSIMIDALMLAMGGRGDASIVRSGEEKCSVSALFHFEANSEPAAWLSAHDLHQDTPESTGEVYLRRVIHTEGRSKAYINGQLFPLQKIKAFSELLLDIHGQHQHQRLLKPATHRTQLDLYANHQTLLNQVHTTYQAWSLLKQKKAQAESQPTDAAHVDFLNYQISELRALNLEPNEVTQLNQEHQCLHHAKSYLEDIARIQDVLRDEVDATPNVQTQLYHVTQHLHALPQDNTHLQAAAELIETARIQCEEAAHEVEHFARLVQLDPERLHAIESRLSVLHDMARKYHIEPDTLSDKLQQLEEEALKLEHAEEEQQRLQQALDNATSDYQKAAAQLSASRIKHAQKLEADITNMLKQLGIGQGIIKIMITPLETMQAHGLDKVEYYVSTNPGVPADALSKIASGGELSRISLAIQVITAKRASTPTLFFDEVDVGIGGATAARVGQLLRTLGERLQVFCVTHQPQVAATAHHHLVVKKHTNQTHTFSEVITLKPEEKITEIARMMGGLHITDETREHAKALLLEHEIHEQA